MLIPLCVLSKIERALKQQQRARSQALAIFDIGEKNEVGNQ